MGFKFSHGVAQTSSETLAHENTSNEAPQMEANNIIHLDNFGFSWKRTQERNEELEKAQIIARMTNFFENVSYTGFQLNEFKKQEIESYLAGDDHHKWNILQPHLHQKDDDKSFTFLGIIYKLQSSGNTKTISAKTTQKLMAVKEIVANDTINPYASYRQLAMLIGLIRYCSKVLELHNEDFNAYTATTDMARECQKDIDTWDLPVGILYAKRLQPFTEISRKILIANPRRVRPPWNLDTAITIFIDASKIGWGGIALYPNGVKRIVKERWLQPALWESSVKSEPKAVQEILNALQLPRGAEVIIATDHEGLVWASQAVQIHTATYHRAVKHAEELGLRIMFTFIQGVTNPADQPSRDLPSTASDREIQVLGAAAGAGIAWALHFPSTKMIPNMYVNCK
jgi:hypothetical protein